MAIVTLVFSIYAGDSGLSRNDADALAAALRIAFIIFTLLFLSLIMNAQSPFVGIWQGTLDEARDLLRVVGSCVVASAVAGGLIMTWGVESPVPHGGMFVVPLFTHPLLFCLSLAIGTVICGVMLSLWKKPVTERDEEFDELNDQKVKDEEITFTLE